MSEKVFAKMIFSLFYIIKQLFLQIMCKNQLIQFNRFQEIMNNVDLPLVLTHPPEEVRRPDLCRRWLISPFYVFQINIGLNYTCIIFIFSICACTFSTCSFVVFASAAVAHVIIVLLKKSIFYFMNIMYKRIFLNFGANLFINKELISLCSTAHL